MQISTALAEFSWSNYLKNMFLKGLFNQLFHTDKMQQTPLIQSRINTAGYFKNDCTLDTMNKITAQIESV